jgi:tRNA(Ile)-lysidine synthase
MPLPAVLHSLPDGPLVLAVSGGRDSMALLEAAARIVSRRVVAVAAFDHGTGPHATEAVHLVAARARAHGLPFVGGRAPDGLPPTEAAWRAARWRFLVDVARARDASIVTAHTRDDLLETVVMRVLRGSGARGLAAMLVPSPGAPVAIHRPLLDVPRAEVARWAAREEVRWVEDPGNASRRWLRNRVRLDLLPAMERASPGVGEELLALARRAAEVRAALDRCAARLGDVRVRGAGRTLVIAASDLAGYDADALAALWPALAARLGLALDRRGTNRAAAFTIRARQGGTVQLSGGFELQRRRVDRTDAFVLGRTARSAGADDGVALQPLVPGARMGPWRFRLVEDDPRPGDDWGAALPGDVPLSVRAWRPGDRLRAGPRRAARRVKRFFADARIPGMDRAGWPVVLAAGEIIWIPGVRRADAATDRSGGPGVRYVCERISSD